MTEQGPPPHSGRRQLLLIAAVFLGPLLVAAWMYFNGSLQPDGRANHGALLEPIINIPDKLPDSPLPGLQGEHWALLYVHRGRCDERCREGLYTTRQLRLMLGREMERLTRIFLHGETAPDTVFLAEEHAGLVSLEDEALAALLASKRPAGLTDDGYYLVDPFGNLVMYFQPELAPREILSDIKRLLKLSHIG